MSTREITATAPPESPRCARCGEQAPAGTGRCPNCQTWLPGNRGAQKHGLFARQLPEAVREEINRFETEVVAAQGGAVVLSDEPVRGALVRSLVNAERLERLAVAGVVRAGGLDTAAGQKLADRALAAIAAKVRLSAVLGLERRQRRVPNLAEVLAGRREVDR